MENLRENEASLKFELAYLNDDEQKGKKQKRKAFNVTLMMS